MTKKFAGAAAGKAASKKEREDTGSSDSTLVYGEIAFDPMAIAFQKIKEKYGGLQRAGGVFLDVGAGTGKPVVAALVLHEFEEVRGIEILLGLHRISVEIANNWHSLKGTLPGVSPAQKACRVVFGFGDCTEAAYDVSDCTLLFANSTCFDDMLMEKIAKKADTCKPGTFFITFTRRLPSINWEVLEHERHMMSWGEATVYIHRRLPLDESDPQGGL